MPAYLVRMRIGKHKHELVGVFVAEDVDSLAHFVDHCTDPHYCECLELPDGGFFFSGRAPKLPTEVESEDDVGPQWFVNPEFTGLWEDIFHDPKTDKGPWERVGFETIGSANENHG